MKKKLRIVLAQLNTIVGDIKGNLDKHIEAAIMARDKWQADVIVFPELGLTGYPPEDLLLRKSFIHDAHAAFEKFLSVVSGIHCLISYPHANSQGLYNSCVLLHDHVILGRYAKQHLPNHGVFDEYRYFTPGKNACVVPIHGIPVGLVICEDLWQPEPIQQAAAQGARLILSPNASPFESNKHEQRISLLSKKANFHSIPIIYVNNVGGQDELVFDGGSMLIDHQGRLAQFAGFFNDTLLACDVDIVAANTPVPSFTVPSKEERIYQSLVTGLRDYVNKNHFPGVLIGLSGGIDSALTLAIAVDALGHDRVHAVYMPSQYSSVISTEEAALVAANLKVKLTTISIQSIYRQFLETLAPCLASKKPGLTEENLQSRCRAVILMALSNQSGHLVLTTGNRSELAVGYCTIYGDMAGGYAVLKDVPKTLVYALARYRNQLQAVIPERTIQRAPTAELAPNQKDEDSLPPYSILDAILNAYLDQGLGIDDIIAQGFEAETVNQVVNLIHKSEYKRRQAPIGTHINHKSFGKDWRYPVTNLFKG